MEKNQRQAKEYALQGFLLGILPVFILGAYAKNPLLPGNMCLFASFLAVFLLLAGVSILFTYRPMSKILLSAGLLLNLFILYFEFLQNPLLTLFFLLLTIGAFYYLFTARLHPAVIFHSSLQLERIIGCSCAGILLSVLSPLFSAEFELFSLACSVNMFLQLAFLGKYCKLQKYFHWRKSILFLLFFAWLTAIFFTWRKMGILINFLLSPILLFSALKHKHADLKYLELIIAHPARCLALTFLGLCIAGTLLLRTPAAMNTELTILDAAFTAVSAVCVTGLTVIDISSSLTLWGQFFLLILIQLGGLGIMTLTTLALHAIGRLSLSGEQLITELTQGGEKENVFQSLRLILRYTLLIEFTGAILLVICFYRFHGDLSLAARQGIFTSVSAFCNAGFFPGANSLIPYAGEKLLLLIIAAEIIAGGVAPAVIWSSLKVRHYHQMPFLCKMVLGTTFILIFSGTFLLLLFEWNGIFKALPWHDKLVNGFFQSVTLRTAGFNSVPIASLGIPSYFVMILLMFIGGSPGGTAGGIKTTTLSVLFLTFRAAVQNEDIVRGGAYRISWRSIVQAVAVFVAASLVLMTIIMMLVTTQMLDTEQLIFEAVSALATVGLSLDCTIKLDPVGRMIIMGAMFLGRIGPLTLFCLFSDPKNSGHATHPQIKIPLG